MRDLDRTRANSRRRLGGCGWVAVGLLLAVAVPVLAACSTTEFYERERLADHAMAFEADAGLVYIRNKIEAAREGAFGGYGGSAAGGCGCQ